jgi:nucleoside-diphosphate-sugar epimerase
MWMGMRPRTKFQGAVPRVLIDVLSLWASLLIAFLVYFSTHSVRWDHASALAGPPGKFNTLYAQNAILLTAIGLIVFSLSGFYSHTRTYQNRYKLLVIANAVSLTFLIEVLIYSYLLRLGPVPRTVMVLSWLVSLPLIAGSRILKSRLEKSYSISIARKPIGGIRDTEKILVIGGAGYIGSILSRQLLEKGYRVRVLDSLLFGNRSISDLLSNPNFELVQADFRHVESLVKSVQGIDAVVHLAAIVGDPACAINTDLTTEINYAATRMVIEVCKGSNVNRLIFASTCSVYGSSEFLMDEKSEASPISHYARTKLDSERALLDGRTSTLHPTILRLATVFGFSPRPRFDLVVNLLTARAVQDGKIKIFNHEQWRPFIHVQDVARAFVRAVQAPVGLVSGEIFNVGDYKLNYALGQVAEKIREQMPDLQIEYEENQDKRNYRVSFDKIHSHLGFTCQVGLVEGIVEIRQALETGLVKDYRERAFSNYELLNVGRNEVLKSEPNVRLFSVLEPADAAGPMVADKLYAVEAGT